jgi:hypothetical protein
MHSWKESATCERKWMPCSILEGRNCQHHAHAKGFDPRVEEPLEGEGNVEVELTNKDEGEEAKIPKEFMRSVGGNTGREVYQDLNSAPFFIPDKLLGCAAVLQEEGQENH